MTNEEIIKGAKCCFIYHDCRDCPYDCGISHSDCVDKVGVDTLNLIDHLTEEVRLLTEENYQLDSENEWLRAYLNQPVKLRRALEDYMNSQNPKKESKE